MKAYIKPMMIVEPLAINPHWMEYSWGAGWSIDPVIDDVGDVQLQVKGSQEEWGDLWQ